MSVTHRFVSPATDGADATKLRPSDWGSSATNYATAPTHVFGGGALGSLLYRDTGASDGASWMAAPTINVQVYGAVGDGVADDSVAIAAAVAAAAATTVGAHQNRSMVYFPPGIYKITQSAILTQINTTSIRAGIHYVGAGMFTSILRLAPSGSDVYFYNNVATPRTQFCSFVDLGFEGMNPASLAVYTDISVNAKGFRLWATSATGSHEQGFRFTRCRFFGLNTVWETAGDQTTSENTFIQCRFDSIRGAVCTLNNVQSFDHEFYGCDLVNLYGDVFVLGASGGGAIKMFGGNVIMQSSSGADTWFLRNTASGAYEMPLAFNGVKFETLGNFTNLINAGASQQVNATFDKCKIQDTATAIKASFVTVRTYSSVYFTRCSWVEASGNFIRFVCASASATQYGINGEIIFDSCEFPIDWSDRCSVVNVGLISARNCYGTNIGAPAAGAHWAHDFDLRSGTVLGQVDVWSGDGSPKDCGSPSHPQWVLKTAALKLEQDAWPLSAGTELTLKLPKGAYIKGVHLRKPIRGAEATNVNLIITNDTKTVTHLTTNTAAWGSVSHTGDVDNYFYCVGDTTTARTLRLANGGAPSQFIYGGLCIVEYY